MNIYTTIGANIQKARKKRKMTQKQLAHRLSEYKGGRTVTQPMISDYEHASEENRMRSYQFFCICHILNADPDQLWREDYIPRETEQTGLFEKFPLTCEEFKKQISKKLKEAQAEKKISHYELLERFDSVVAELELPDKAFLNYSTVYKYQQKNVDAELDNLIILACLYDLKLSDFIL